MIWNPNDHAGNTKKIRTEIAQHPSKFLICTKAAHH